MRLVGGALVAGLVWPLVGAAVATSAGELAEATGFRRPDPQTIRAEVHQILADPRYRPHRSFWQWLWGKLSAWHWPDFDFSHTWAKLLWGFLLFWCVLALAAVVAHLVWTVVQLVRNLAPTSGLRPRRGRRGAGGASFDELQLQVGRLAAGGAYREAVRAMMAALLRWLDGAGALRYHESKTNGEYVSELAARPPAREDFRDFVFAFERCVYGGGPCGPQTYEQLGSVFERIRSHVIEGQES